MAGYILGVGESRIRHFLFLKKSFYLFISFVCAGSSLLQGLFSSCAEWDLLFSWGGLLIVVPTFIAEHKL